MTSMGERLQTARKAAGYASAAKAARALGVTESTYRAHENGQNEFSKDEAVVYGRKFKASPDGKALAIMLLEIIAVPVLYYAAVRIWLWVASGFSASEK